MTKTVSERLKQVLQQTNLGFDLPLERAGGGQRNEVWFCGSYLLRMNSYPHSNVLHQEAHLLAQLPATIPHPTVYAYGRDGSGEWMIQTRIHGEPLAHVWARMNMSLRRRVVEQLAAILETLHQVSIDDKFPSLSPYWLQSTLPAQIAEHAQEAKTLPLIDTGLMDEVIRLAEATIVSVPPDRYWGLIHRDLHFDNVLWDGDQITALLDFESACYAPIDLELDLLLRFCAFPFLYVTEEYEPLAQPQDYRMVPVWLHQFYPRPFQLPDIRKRLCLYSLAYDLKQLLQFPPRDILDIYADEHPLNRIRTIVERTLYIDWQ